MALRETQNLTGARESSTARTARSILGAAQDSEEHAALVERIRAGHAPTFDAFIQRHWPRLVYFVSTRVGNVETARDIAQQSFFRLWTHREDLQPGGSILTYLYRIARNLAIDELRKDEVRRRWSAELEAAAGDLVESDCSRRFEVAEQLRALQRALESIPPRRREAFTLVHITGLTHREAAAVMGTASQTVANQVAAAIGQLRRALEPYS